MDDVLFPIGSDAEAVYKAFYERFNDGTVKYRQYPEAVIEASKRAVSAHYKRLNGDKVIITKEQLKEISTLSHLNVFPLSFMQAHPAFTLLPYPTIFWQFKDGNIMEMNQYFCLRK